MKVKEEIKNLTDVRRNLWIAVIGIVGSVAFALMKTTAIVFTWLSIIKLIIILIGGWIVVCFMNQIVYCNGRIDLLIKEMKE